MNDYAAGLAYGLTESVRKANRIESRDNVRFLDPIDNEEKIRGTADTPTLAFESALSEWLYLLGEETHSE